MEPNSKENTITEETIKIYVNDVPFVVPIAWIKKFSNSILYAKYCRWEADKPMVFNRNDHIFKHSILLFLETGKVYDVVGYPFYKVWEEYKFFQLDANVQSIPKEIYECDEVSLLNPFPELNWDNIIPKVDICFEKESIQWILMNGIHKNFKKGCYKMEIEDVLEEVDPDESVDNYVIYKRNRELINAQLSAFFIKYNICMSYNMTPREHLDFKPVVGYKGNFGFLSWIMGKIFCLK